MTDSIPTTRTKVELPKLDVGGSLERLELLTTDDSSYILAISYASNKTQFEEIAHRCNVYEDLFDLACNAAGMDPGGIDRNADVNSLRAALHELRNAAIAAKHKAEGRAEAASDTAGCVPCTGTSGYAVPGAKCAWCGNVHAVAPCNYEPDAEGHCTKCGRRHYPEALDEPCISQDEIDEMRDEQTEASEAKASND